MVERRSFLLGLGLGLGLAAAAGGPVADSEADAAGAVLIVGAAPVKDATGIPVRLVALF